MVDRTYKLEDLKRKPEKGYPVDDKPSGLFPDGPVIRRRFDGQSKEWIEAYVARRRKEYPDEKE